MHAFIAPLVLQLIAVSSELMWYLGLAWSLHVAAEEC